MEGTTDGSYLLRLAVGRFPWWSIPDGSEAFITVHVAHALARAKAKVRPPSSLLPFGAFQPHWVPLLTLLASVQFGTPLTAFCAGLRNPGSDDGADVPIPQQPLVAHPTACPPLLQGSQVLLLSCALSLLVSMIVIPAAVDMQF